MQIKFFDAVQNNIRLQKIHLPTLSMSDYQIVAAAINENIKFHEMSAKFLDLANQISDINEFYFTPEQVASEDTCILLKISLMLELLEIYSDIDTIRSRKLFQSLKATLSDILTNLFVHRKMCIFGLEEYLAPNAELRGFYCIQAMAEALSTLDSTQNREACIAEVVVNSFDLLHDEKGAELVLNPECQTVLDCYLLEGAGIIARPGSFAMDERMRMELKNQLLFRYLANEGRIEIENSKKRSLIEGEFAPEKKAMLQHASESKKRSIFQSAVLPNNKKTTLEAETDTVTHSL